MSVRVRLTRVGAKKNPIWRVVVADQRSPRDGRFIETVGQYNPQTDPSTIVLDEERLQHWIARGAQPTGTVKQLMKAHRKGLSPKPAETPVPAAAAPATPAEPAAAEVPEGAEPEAAKAAEPEAAEPEAEEAAELEAAEPEAAAEPAEGDSAERSPE